MFDVQILYEKSCPNYKRACEILCGVISEYELEANIIIREVKKSDTIFYGSPTLLIGSTDVEKCFLHQTSDLNSQFDACRIYQCTDHVGCPSAEMIVCTLKSLNII